jgi:NTP pyrophosphatase (non-canonical NTP hydrolase)
MFEYLENMSSEVAAVSFVGKEYAKAKAKHPEFPENLAEAHCIISEELGELAEAINDKQDNERMREEAAHVAVTAIRFLEMLEK